MKPEIHAWQIELDGPVTDYTESIFTIGNGYLGMRGYDLQTPKTRKDQHALFPANYHQALDMRKGIFTQTWQERGLTVSMLRIASMADPQLLCVRMALTSEWDQTVTVQARMDDRVANLPVHDDQMVEETETVPLLKTLEKTNDTLTMQAVSSGRHIHTERHGGLLPPRRSCGHTATAVRRTAGWRMGEPVYCPRLSRKDHRLPYVQPLAH